MTRRKQKAMVIYCSLWVLAEPEALIQPASLASSPQDKRPKIWKSSDHFCCHALILTWNTWFIVSKPILKAASLPKWYHVQWKQRLNEKQICFSFIKKKSNYPIKNFFLIFFEDNIKSEKNKAACIKLYPQFILKVTQDCVRRWLRLFTQTCKPTAVIKTDRKTSVFNGETDKQMVQWSFLLG